MTRISLYISPQEKWSALYDVRTILLSIQSLLAEPNNDSPLNVDAAELWTNQAGTSDKIDSSLVSRSNTCYENKAMTRCANYLPAVYFHKHYIQEESSGMIWPRFLVPRLLCGGSRLLLLSPPLEPGNEARHETNYSPLPTNVYYTWESILCSSTANSHIILPRPSLASFPGSTPHTVREKLGSGAWERGWALPSAEQLDLHLS